MNDTDKIEKKIALISTKIDTLILIELCKQGVTRTQAREILGTLSNETYAKVNLVFKK